MRHHPKLAWTRLLLFSVFIAVNAHTKSPVASFSKYPISISLKRVGQYPALAKSGGGYFYDEVLEYRVWVHPGGDDYYKAFATFEEAKSFSIQTLKAEEPIVLVLQHEHVNEPKQGTFEYVKGDRITEWRIEWLEGKKRTPTSIPDFLKQHSIPRSK